jgi:hypothetical protein
VVLELGFKDRRRLLPSVRRVVADLCEEYLASPDTSQLLVLAVQELLENLVKYSQPEPSAFEFELTLLNGQPTARIGTKNHAAPVHLRQVQIMLDRIISSPDPVGHLQSLVASSGEHAGSGLGLARLRGESELALSYTIEAGRLSIEAKCTVEPRSAA